MRCLSNITLSKCLNAFGRCRIMEAVSLGALVVTERGVDHTLDAMWADKVLPAILSVRKIGDVLQGLKAYWQRCMVFTCLQNPFADGIVELAARLGLFLAGKWQRRTLLQHSTLHHSFQPSDMPPRA